MAIPSIPFAFIILSGLAATLSLSFFHFSPTAFLTFVWQLILIQIGISDQRTMRIPDHWNLLLFMVGLISIPFMKVPHLSSRIAGMLVVSLPMLMISLISSGAFGGGDIKLMAAAGFFLGWRGNLLAFILALFASGLFGTGLLLTKRAGRKDVFPFGPFLCGGLVTAAFMGEKVIDWFIFG